MPPEDGMTPENDIQQALDQAQSMGASSTGQDPAPDAMPAADTLAQTHQGCPVRMVRYAIYKCGLMAEKYPCQTLGALLITAGCGWVCSYFGLTVLAALLLVAVNAEE